MTTTQQARPVQQVSITDPAPREVVNLPPGTKLHVSFTSNRLLSQWWVEDCPGHLVLLDWTRRSFTFLVFTGPADAAPLVLVRTGGTGADELYEIQVLTAG